MGNFEKSAGKSAPGIPFAVGEDPRRGSGPEPGAPNAGRPRSAVRAACHETFERRYQIAEEIASNPAAKDADRLRALELLARWAGIEKLTLGLDGGEGDGSDEYGIIEMPPLDPRPSLEGP